MVFRTELPRLTDIVEAILRIRELLDKVPVAELEADWQKKWMLNGVLKLFRKPVAILARN